MIQSLMKLLISPEILGPLLGVLFSVLIIEFLLPFLREKKRVAKNKLNKFYNVAYAFVRIREDFSVNISGIIHNKENCGYFHEFNTERVLNTSKTFDQTDQLISRSELSERVSGTIFDEQKFFQFVAESFSAMDTDLRDYFIEYFKARGPENIQKGIGCTDSKLIRLRKDIERLIVFYYRNYSRVVERI